MKLRKLTIVLFAAAQMSAANFVSAQTVSVTPVAPMTPPGPPPFGKPNLSDLLTRMLLLTDAQKAQVKTIREKYAPQQLELRKSVQATGAPPDEATRAKIADLQNQQAAEIRAILIADQQKTFDHNLHEMKERMDARRNGSS